MPAVLRNQLAFLSRLALALGLSDASALSVASAAFQRIEALSDFAKRTNLVSVDTQKIRDAIRHADDPEKLLFETFPGLEIEGELAEKTVAAIEECEAAYSLLADDLRRALAQAIGVPSDTFAGSQERAESIKGLSSDLKFEAFAARVGSLSPGQAVWKRWPAPCNQSPCAIGPTAIAKEHCLKLPSLVVASGKPKPLR